jgi:hypothetical protein
VFLEVLIGHARQRGCCEGVARVAILATQAHVTAARKVAQAKEFTEVCAALHYNYLYDYMIIIMMICINVLNLLLILHMNMRRHKEFADVGAALICALGARCRERERA